MAEVSFVVASPGWDVLYYFKGGRYETAPIIAWAVVVQDDIFVRATPVTTDLAWSLEDDRTICTPDGDVTHGELEHWPNVPQWLADMERREREAPDKLPAERPTGKPQGDGNAPIVLDNFRRKFGIPHGDGA